jgi:hypothetical protein
MKWESPPHVTLDKKIGCSFLQAQFFSYKTDISFCMGGDVVVNNTNPLTRFLNDMVRNLG